MPNTCCPAYVIRLDAMRYTPSDTHKRVLRRLRRFAAADVELAHCPSAVSSTGCEGGGTNRIRRRREGDDVGSRGWLVEVIVQAVDEIVGDGAGECALKLGRDDVESVKRVIKVFPPRSNDSLKKKKRKSEGGDLHLKPEKGTGDADIQWVSNVALLLGAAERKREVEVGEKQFEAAREKGKKKGLKEEQKERQMEIAGLLARFLNSALRAGWVVIVSAPGFLNFAVEKDEMEMEIDEAIHQHTGDEECIDVGNAATSSLKAELSGGKNKKTMRMSSTLLSNDNRLSRIGSAVSADRNIRGDDDGNSVAPEFIESSLDELEKLKASPQRAKQILEELSEGVSFKMELVPAQFMPEAYEVFRKYQTVVHKERPDQCNEQAYRRFLVDSPLIQWRSAVDLDQVYGSFHMLYKVRGRLIAVGVVDILPRCLSSVYLFYDPDFARLSPGTLSALKEIEWTRKSNGIYPSLQFYYMGYYIHSCGKMKYKASYQPSELLCETTRNWVPVPYAQRVLDTAPQQFARLAPEDVSPAPDAKNFAVNDVERETLAENSIVQVSVEGDGFRIFSFRVLNRLLHPRYPEEMDALRKKIGSFVELVGKANAKFYIHVL